MSYMNDLQSMVDSLNVYTIRVVYSSVVRPVRRTTKTITIKLNYQFIELIKKFHGKAVDIGENGGLRVKLDDGKEETFLSGDVTFMR